MILLLLHERVIVRISYAFESIKYKQFVRYPTQLSLINRIKFSFVAVLFGNECIIYTVG